MTTITLDWIILDKQEDHCLSRWYYSTKITKLCAVDSKIFKLIEYHYHEDASEDCPEYEEFSDICFCMSDDDAFIWEDVWDYTDLILKYLNK